MVSGRWSSRTTMLSSHCVKTGVAFDQIQFATEFHDESESSSRRAWLGTLNFEKSTIRQLNWSWLHQTLETAQVSFSNEVLYCRCLITNNKEYRIDRTSSHTTMQSRKVIIFTSQGQDPRKSSIMRSSTRSKMTKWYCKVKHRIQREKQIIQSDQDVHVYGLWWMEWKLLLYGLSLSLSLNLFESMTIFASSSRAVWV